MAEHSESNEALAREKMLVSSTSSNDPSKTVDGGKSPGKTKKLKKVSLFKKTTLDEGNFTRSSGRGKRKSGREKKLDRETVEESQPAEVLVPYSPPAQPAEASYQYDTQEVEQKSSIDLSFKKVQRLNKELEKRNTQLAKSVETLKRERELLVSEKVKLKTENKSLEKELKKASSKDRVIRKTSQPTPAEEAAGFDADVLREKIQILEDQLTERDRVATLLKLRLDNMETSETTTAGELEVLERSIHTKNGAMLDSTAALEMLIEEHDNSQRMRRENEELRLRLQALEAELDAYKATVTQREGGVSHPSPKSPRKKSTNFFKRGKKSTSSLKQQQASQEDYYARSQSPDTLGKSDSHHEQLDVTGSSPLLSHTNKESSVSLPCYGSPTHSPLLPGKSRVEAEILTLQSCLKLALEEKSVYNEDKLQLEKELDGAKSKIAELEESVSTATEKAAADLEEVKGRLKSAEIERDTYCEELKIAQQEVDEWTEKVESLEQTYANSLSEKNKQIQDLEWEVAVLKRGKAPPPAPSTTAPSTSPKKTVSSPARERLLSPPQQHLVSSETSPASTEDKPHHHHHHHHRRQQSGGDRPRERRLSSSDSSPKHEKPSRLTRQKSIEKLAKAAAVAAAVPPSPTRKVGRLSRESSIDRFETPPKEPVRKHSTSGVSSPSLAHSPKVAATRAMFEQKIDETKTDLSNVRRLSSKASSSSSILDAKRRSSVSTATPTGEDKAQTSQHSKSYSCDFATTKQAPKKAEQNQSQPSSTGNAGRARVFSPTPLVERVNEASPGTNEAGNARSSTQQERTQVITAAVSQKKGISSSSSSSTAHSAKSSESLAKVSRITVTSVASPTSSPVLGPRKDVKEVKIGSPRGEKATSPAAVFTKTPTSPSLGSSAGTPAKSVFQTPSASASSRPQTGAGAGGATKVSTVSTTVRHSAPSKAATMSEIPTSPPGAKTHHHHHPPVKTQTDSKLQLTSSRSSSVSGRVWSGSVHSSSVATTTASQAATTSSSNPPASSSNRVVVRSSTRLGDNLLSSVNNKSGSLQNIPSQLEDGNSSSNQTPAQQSSETSTTKVTTVSVSSRRTPTTHRAVQRRERKDRPKTMYAGRAETANLVNLISKFQEEEKTKPPSSATPPKVNGTSTPMTAVSSRSGTHTFSSSGIPTSVTLRQGGSAKQARPTSFHSTNIHSASSKPGFSFQPPPSYNNNSSSSSSSKPALQRWKAVAGGLGSNKLSKKAMLLKWCQFITQDYENVNIMNFAESFSNGLAFCALIHHFLPDQIPFNTLNPANRENNFRLAFKTAEDVGIPSLLDVEDMVSLPKPDWMSVMTYVSFIYNKFGQQTQQQQQSSMV